ncbi:beta-galactosidase [Bacillus sp. JJ722]|uniref:beta-galactosidase n=1 Tax=Bacillus sp. JJ722 TaxID=3122973 RepID=UPI002FFEC736
MIEFKHKQIFIDGKPQLLMCGEIHYYRLDVSEWEDRVIKLKESGCNAVASYIPWICHEEKEGEVDLTGHTRPELNLKGFIELCQKYDLFFIPRPGPFIMAEMKNDGIPFWVHEKHPEIIPTTWDGNKVTTVSVDNLNPNFLEESKHWYREVFAILIPFLHCNGGNIIGIQLDNEVGMLSWVSNCPEFTDVVLEDFNTWLHSQYGEELVERYPNVDFTELNKFRKSVESPSEDFALQLRQDLGVYMRYRYTKYFTILREYAEELGVKDILWIINIHGTSAGRACTLPIGISQLYETYADGKCISGSDIYLGDLTMTNFVDLYVNNAFMDACHNEHQPLTCLEFECGDGNYGERDTARYDVSAADFKTRMLMAQGFKLLNYYLFCGGRNYRLADDHNDGNNRIATTGERHGFAAPISPEGEKNYTYPRMEQSIQTMMAVGNKLATMTEETDDLALAFIPDYFMTEHHYPKSEKMKRIVENLTNRRAYDAWDTMVKAVLLNGYRFTSIDIQNKPIAGVKTLLVTSALYMHPHIQQKLVDFMNAGGNVLLYGEVPVYDMEGNKCSILMDALGVTSASEDQIRWDYYLSIYGDGWAANRAEVRAIHAQALEVEGVEPLFRIYGNDKVCGFEKNMQQGKCIVIATSYICHVPFFKSVVERLGVSPQLYHDYTQFHGLFTTMTKNEEGERFVHILNFDGYNKPFTLQYGDQKLFDGRSIEIGSKRGLMLPLNVRIQEQITIVYATAEVNKVEENALTFRLTQREDVIVLDTEHKIADSPDYNVEMKNGYQYITSNKNNPYEELLTITFQS